MREMGRGLAGGERLPITIIRGWSLELKAAPAPWDQSGGSGFTNGRGLRDGSGQKFRKGPDSKYYSLCRPKGNNEAVILGAYITKMQSFRSLWVTQRLPLGTHSCL